MDVREPAPLAVVVDDNLLFSMRVETALRALGFRVRTLGAGLPSLPDELAREPPRFVLLNLASTRIDALPLVRSLRAHPALSSTQVFGFTGHTDSETIRAALAAGADQVFANSAVSNHLGEVLLHAGVLAPGAAEAGRSG